MRSSITDETGNTIPGGVNLLSARTWRDVLYRDELLLVEAIDPGFNFALTLTREAPARRSDFARRIDAAMVASVVARLPAPPGDVFVCGSNAFVDVATDATLAAGLGGASIRTERYGG